MEIVYNLTVLDLLTAEAFVLLEFGVIHKWLHHSSIIAKSLFREAETACLFTGLWTTVRKQLPSKFRHFDPNTKVSFASVLVFQSEFTTEVSKASRSWGSCSWWRLLWAISATSPSAAAGRLRRPRGMTALWPEDVQNQVNKFSLCSN